MSNTRGRYRIPQPSVGPRIPRPSIGPLVVILVTVLLFVLSPPAPSTAVGHWEEKVDPTVLTAARDGEAEFIIFLREQARLAEGPRPTPKRERGRLVYATLREVADRTQPALTTFLDAVGADYTRFWIANLIWVRGAGAETLARIAQRDDVARIVSNHPLGLNEATRVEEQDATSASARSPHSIEWNVLQVRAPEVWAEGYTGQGAVLGAIDTGFDWDHPALINQYRGWNGSTAVHDYNWHDAIHVGGGACGPDSPEPCDMHGHGTIILGNMVGDDGGANQIGVAPGARWIGCRCWEVGQGSALAYVTECLQWMVAPTDVNGENPDPDRAPHAINNSWVCEPWEGCTDPIVLLTVVQNVRSAGILVEVGAGNNGPECSSIYFPPAIYDPSYTIGATDVTDAIAWFSSRGPVIIDGSGRLKPDVSAPGADIRSSVPGGGYQGGWNGTSIAGPHVVGAVGLLIAARPELAGQVDELEAIINETAVPQTTSQTCGDIPGSEVPNHAFGYGRLDAYAAYQRAVTVDVSEYAASDAAARAVLLASSPDPFGRIATIRFRLAGPSPVKIQAFDVAGRRVRSLLDADSVQPGQHEITWNGRDDVGRDLPSGTYFVRLQSGGRSEVRRVTLAR